MDLARPLATVTPTLDGDVLTVLARHPDALTIGQVRQALAGPSAEGVRKVLHRLTHQGVVRSARVGNVATFRLNREHLAAPHITALAELADAFLGRLARRLRRWEPVPLYAAVFGSAARGDMHAGSDIDILLVAPGTGIDPRWETAVAELVVDGAEWLGNDVRPLILPAGEIIARGHAEPVLRDVLADGITVLGSRSWLADAVRTPGER
ncbi:hypothetical protein GCM10010123_02820 [Pilimelia anulata]|uniref:Polymerase nucleotidyl transferase domain-containing protein n=1 Tax=Pilimelia anulata TaxID=53371 RepID=A0A8J3B6H6_9ACTN|nr:nucleotidyltransferase domain-containing protein [Pilimelia anulata]GGJ76292.1 hypothetical protein GCM10010123_02820 [Pilimelia anulata]